MPAFDVWGFFKCWLSAIFDRKSGFAKKKKAKNIFLHAPSNSWKSTFFKTINNIAKIYWWAVDTGLRKQNLHQKNRFFSGPRGKPFQQGYRPGIFDAIVFDEFELLYSIGVLALCELTTGFAGILSPKQSSYIQKHAPYIFKNMLLTFQFLRNRLHYSTLRVWSGHRWGRHADCYFVDNHDEKGIYGIFAGFLMDPKSSQNSQNRACMRFWL